MVFSDGSSKRSERLGAVSDMTKISEAAKKLSELRLYANLPEDISFPCRVEHRQAVDDDGECGRCRRAISRSGLEQGLCPDCLQRQKEDDISRMGAGELLLRIRTGDSLNFEFLFAPKTLLIGRAKKDQAIFQLPVELGGGQKRNDLVLRRMEEVEGILRPLESQSRLISRCHAAVSVRCIAGREEACVFDVGSDTRGSPNGTWLNSTRIAAGMMALLSNDDEIVLGKQGEMCGMTLSVHIERDNDEIESVELRRDDALSRLHRYVMVAGRSRIFDRDGVQLGTIRVVDGQFKWIYGDGTLHVLSPNTRIHIGETEIFVENAGSCP